MDKGYKDCPPAEVAMIEVAVSLMSLFAQKRNGVAGLDPIIDRLIRAHEALAAAHPELPRVELSLPGRYQSQRERS